MTKNEKEYCDIHKDIELVLLGYEQGEWHEITVYRCPKCGERNIRR